MDEADPCACCPLDVPTDCEWNMWSNDDTGAHPAVETNDLKETSGKLIAMSDSRSDRKGYNLVSGR